MVKVKLFANFREVAGVKELEICAETVEDVLNELIRRFPRLKELFKRHNYVHIMVNGDIIKDTKFRLKNNDIIAIFPPVSGGYQ